MYVLKHTNFQNNHSTIALALGWTILADVTCNRCHLEIHLHWNTGSAISHDWHKPKWNEAWVDAPSPKFSDDPSIARYHLFRIIMIRNLENWVSDFNASTAMSPCQKYYYYLMKLKYNFVKIEIYFEWKNNFIRYFLIVLNRRLAWQSTC